MIKLSKINSQVVKKRNSGGNRKKNFHKSMFYFSRGPVNRYMTLVKRPFDLVKVNGQSFFRQCHNAATRVGLV